MFENLNEMYPDHKFQDKRKSKKSAYLLLLGLSTLSALVILSLWLIMLTYDNDGMPSLVGFAWIAGILAGQWILVIPATLIVISIHKRLSNLQQLYKMTVIRRAAIPLMFNILAASSLFLAPIAYQWYGNVSGFLLSLNFAATIKEENIIQKNNYGSLYEYDAVLHIENNTGREITASFYLGDYNTKTYQESYESEHQLGYQEGNDWLGLHIPSGDSDIRIKIPISQFILPKFCHNDTLSQPLHLLYSLGYIRYHGFLLVDKKINQRLQELACNAAP